MFNTGNLTIELTPSHPWQVPGNYAKLLRDVICRGAATFGSTDYKPIDKMLISLTIAIRCLPSAKQGNQPKCWYWCWYRRDLQKFIS